MDEKAKLLLRIRDHICCVVRVVQGSGKGFGFKSPRVGEGFDLACKVCSVKGNLNSRIDIIRIKTAGLEVENCSDTGTANFSRYKSKISDLGIVNFSRYFEYCRASGRVLVRCHFDFGVVGSPWSAELRAARHHGHVRR